MKAETAPRVGVIDALGSGLAIAARKPLLLIIPALMDLGLWLTPQIAIMTFLQQVRVVWEAFYNAFYTPAQRASFADMIEVVRTGFDELARTTDLSTALTTGWLAPPSALAGVQATRYKLISDGVLAPVGFGLNLPQIAPPPWQSGVIEIKGFLPALLVVVGLWLIGQVLTTIYLRESGKALLAGDGAERVRKILPPRIVPSEPADPSTPNGEQPQGQGVTVKEASGIAAFRPTLVRFIGLSLFLGVIVYLMRLPLALATALAVFGGGSLAAALFVVSGGITLWFMLWFLSSVFFASEAVLFDGQGLWQALWRGLLLTRASGWRAFGLIVVINLLALGSRAVWGIIGSSPLGALLAIVGNAYLVTGLVLAVFIFYGGLRREWQAQRTARRVAK
jgi:hypothetical protein